MIISDAVTMYKDKEVKKNVKDIFLSMCEVKIFRQDLGIIKANFLSCLIAWHYYEIITSMNYIDHACVN
jgi:hypothetical protein